MLCVYTTKLKEACLPSRLPTVKVPTARTGARRGPRSTQDVLAGCSEQGPLYSNTFWKYDSLARLAFRHGSDVALLDRRHGRLARTLRRARVSSSRDGLACSSTDYSRNLRPEVAMNLQGCKREASTIPPARTRGAEPMVRAARARSSAADRDLNIQRDAGSHKVGRASSRLSVHQHLAAPVLNPAASHPAPLTSASPLPSSG